MNVVGSDGCAFAGEKARELARLEGHDIEFFTSRWADLRSRTGRRFDGIFNDALSWTRTREEFEASLRGFLAALKPRGIFVFMGATKGSASDPARRRKLLRELWQQRPKFSIEWTREHGGTRCTSVLVRERGDTFVDEHHVYLIEQKGESRIETASIRQPVTWHWDVLDEMFREAGFASLDTHTFAGMASDGSDLALNVATKPS